MSEAEFNQEMVRRFVAEGKGSSLTPSKNAWVKLKDFSLGKVSFGILPDVPNKTSGEVKWVEPSGTTSGGSKGGVSGPSEKAESMWTNRDLDSSIMVYMEPHPRRLRIKLNPTNKVLTDLFITGMDARYNYAMDELIDEIFVYLRSVGSMLDVFDMKMKEGKSTAASDDLLYEDDNNYFLDTAFKKWWTDSKSINKLVKTLEEKKKDM